MVKRNNNPRRNTRLAALSFRVSASWMRKRRRRIFASFVMVRILGYDSLFVITAYAAPHSVPPLELSTSLSLSFLDFARNEKKKKCPALHWILCRTFWRIWSKAEKENEYKKATHKSSNVMSLNETCVAFVLLARTRSKINTKVEQLV